MGSYRKNWLASTISGVIVLLMLSLVSGNIITVALGVVTSPSPALPLTNCDGVGIFYCPTGTCYTGFDSFVGCCSVSSCAARTTCIPYTTGVTKSCDVNTGGCVTCSAEMPACVTIKNIVNNQYIMYCGQQAIVETLSYSNLVTTGSMALPPSRTNSYSMALAPSTAATSSTLAPTPSTKNVATGFFIPTDGPVSNPGGTSPVTVFEIVAGAVSGLMIVGVIYVKCYRVRSRRECVMNFIAAKFRRGHSGAPDNSRPSTNASSTMAPRGRASITTTNAMNMNDFISPIAHDRMARLAEARDAHAEELESTQPAYELDPESQVDESWVHPALRYSRSGNPSTRWSTNNAPRPHNGRDYTNREIDNYFTPDLPTQPAGFRPYIFESVDSLVVSPNLSTNADSPLIGGVSPLMGKDNRASVGEAPIRRGSITHMTTKPRQSWARKRCESPLFGAPGIANATGGGLPYTAPETALAQGYKAGQNEISGVETTADKANGHEDIIHVETNHEDTASRRESAAEEANHAEPSHTETASHQESATRDE